MRVIFLVLSMLFLSGFVSADHVITNYLPSDGNTCVVGGNISFRFYIDEVADAGCILYTNETGSFLMVRNDITADLGFNNFNHEITDPNTIMWFLGCADISPPDIEFSVVNTSFTITDAPYCAVLSDTSCPSEGALNSEINFKTKLGNTLGNLLENQDCNVWIEDSDGVIIKKFNTMLVNQKTNLQIDDGGNWINTGSNEAILTDSQGLYIFPFFVDSVWAYFGEIYTVKATCNGQITSCEFQVTGSKPADIDRWEFFFKEFSGLVFLLVFFVTIAFVIIKRWRRKR